MNVLLFDIDGTLVNTGGAGGQALKDALASEFGVTEPAAVSFQGRTDRGIARDFFQAHGIDDVEDSWRRYHRAYLRHLATHLPLRPGSVLPGIVALLEAAAIRDDVAVGLLTGNVREGARLKLEHYRLHHHFRFGGYGDLHPLRDDVAREALADAVRILADSTPRRVIVIGDTVHDIRCSRAIDAVAVAVCTGTVSRDELAAESPDVLLDDLSDAAPLLRLLNA
ncbi:MAG: HAD family hydrolase [Pirellulaceae bacterium]